MTTEPIAVTGLSCRLPGAPDPAAFWRLLRSGASAIGDPPAGRPELLDLRHRWQGGFLEHIDRFDAEFFGITPREAAATDPQQRLALELAWEVLENAGVIPAELAGTDTGVFLGVIWDDYAQLVHRYGPDAVTHTSMAGLSRGIIANRVSYTFGLHGPSMVVDTGQSSSLVAVELACESLRRGESNLALAGGVSLIAGPDGFVLGDRFGALSPDGQLRTFDAQASGYVRGEGGAMVALRTLSAALAAGDPIYAVIRGGAVNNDGGGDSLTAPNRAAQEEVLRRAYRRAGVEPAAVRFVELHGTGTPVGDPVEAAALGAVLGGGSGRPADRPLLVGSVKTNIGHLEGAAGIAGLVKAVLCLRERTLAPSLNFATANPRIPLDALGLRVATGATALADPGQPLYAGVSSFGMGGTNCHLVLAEAPQPDPVEPAAGERIGPITVPLSARTPAALRDHAHRLRAVLTTDTDAELPDVAFTLATTRSRFAHRAVLLAADRPRLLDQLDALAAGRTAPDIIADAVTPGTLAILFSGQGSQRAGMGRDLSAAFPVFARSLDEVCTRLDPELDRPLRDVMFAPTGSADADLLHQTGYTQPALFAYEVALYRLLESCGVTAGVLLGHSIGELTAAYVSGLLTLDDAGALVGARSRLMQALPAGGAMAALQATEEEVLASIADDPGRVAIAAVNGPTATVVAGDTDAVLAVTAHWRSRGRKTRRLQVSHAFHSPLMEPILADFSRAAQRLAIQSMRVPVVSNVTGQLATAEELGSGQYWVRHARATVRFSDGVRTALDGGADTFLEVGPDSVLTALARDWAAPGPEFIAAVRGNRPEVASVLAALARLWARGIPVDWRSLLSAARFHALPSYPFQRERHWLAGSAVERVARVAATDPAAVPDVEAEVPGVEPGGPTATGRQDTDQPGGSSLAGQLAGASRAEQHRIVSELVRAEIANVMGHATAERIDLRSSFKDLGFDSLTGVELCERLAEASGLPIARTLVFDYPTGDAVAGYLRSELSGIDRAAITPVDAGRHDSEPIAVVGMGCRFGGGVGSPEELWRLVVSGGEVLSDFPVDRGWDLGGLFDSDPDRLGTSYVRRGHFLTDVGGFDAGFFGISPREALAMDPQQRLLLEVAWEAVEDARIDPLSLRGSRTGVYAGVFSYRDYGIGTGRVPSVVEGQQMTGGALSVLSGRISYSLGLEGPAVTVDTACSSSLVALHLACQALRAGECDLAVVGGVTVMSTPATFVELSRQRGLSRDGRVRAFGVGADGTGWGEGVGVLVLERLSDAVAAGRRVWGLVVGSAVNQDGASNGLTAPNGPSQRRVIGAALGVAGLSVGDVDVVEGHGTGTRLGDPIEAQALLATYGRRVGDPLWLGSVKSNIGHTQAAAGVAGVMKVLLAMRYGVLPRTLHVEEPTPLVDWSSGGVRLLVEERGWPRRAGWVRRGGVSSFGISGTNAHVILAEPPVGVAEFPVGVAESPVGVAGSGVGVAGSPAVSVSGVDGGGVGPVVPVVVSARSGVGLVGVASRLAGWVRDRPGLSVVDVGWSLWSTRAGLEHRAVVVTGSRSGLLAGLASIAADQVPADAATVTVPDAGSGGGGAGTGDGGSVVVRGVVGGFDRVVFVFPGQGSQWPGMAAGLLSWSAVFRDELAVTAAAVGRWSDIDVLTAMADPDQLARIEVVQPVLFAVHVALARWWQAYGLSPDVVVGHSQGEIAAACVAGALTLDDAARLVVIRSRIFARHLTGQGAVASLSVGPEHAEQLLTGYHGRLVIAGINSPHLCTIAGPVNDLNHLVTHCDNSGIRARLIPATVASHSPQVEPLRQQLHTELDFLTPQPATIPIASTVTTTHLTGTELTADYWYENCRQPVNFATTITQLLTQTNTPTAFIEISAHPVLTYPIQDTTDTINPPHQPLILHTLHRDHDNPTHHHTQLAHAHTHGLPITHTPTYTPHHPTTTDLPTYPFTHHTYWINPPTGRRREGSEHPLLGRPVPLADTDRVVMPGTLSRVESPWLADHGALGTVLFPGAGLVELGLYAGSAVGASTVEELALELPLPLAAEVDVQVLVEATDDTGRRAFSIHARTVDGAPDRQWSRHASGYLTPADGAEPVDDPDLIRWPPPGATPLDLDGWYATLAERGYDYGPAFQGLRAAWRRGDEVFADLALPVDLAPQAADFAVHPALLDAALHAVELGVLPPAAGTQLPFVWAGVRTHAPVGAEARARLRRVGTDAVSILLADTTGRTLASVSSMTRRPVSTELLATGDTDLYRVDWVPGPATAASVDGWCAVLGPDHLGLAAALTAAGVPVRQVPDLAALAELTRSQAGPPVSVFAAAAPLTDHDRASAAHALADWTMTLAQSWLADERFVAARLVLVTRHAIGVRPEEAVDPAQAAAVGLMRSACTEHPDRFGLVDIDDPARSMSAVLVALGGGEPQVAVRDRALLVPRLAAVQQPPESSAGWDPDGTVLITGGTGALGRLVARHLATAHGVRHLLLLSRGGTVSAEVTALRKTLAELGAEVVVAACDVADRSSLAAVLDRVPIAHPVTGVVHAAGVLADSMLTSLTSQRLDAVLRPKVDGAWNLHELTRDLPLTAFVLFSSVQGLLGGPGQANYAAGNAFLDALAAHRRSAGQVATALAWGLWREGGMESGLDDADRDRMAQQSGMRPLPADRGMTLFDAALGTGLAGPVPVNLDRALLRTRGDGVPPLLRQLVPQRPQAGRAGVATSGPTLTRRLALLPAGEQERFLIGVVRTEVAATLNHATAEAVDVRREFKELGFDSLTAVQLRNRLSQATGLRLPATLIFDYPTPIAVAGHLRAELVPGDDLAGAPPTAPDEPTPPPAAGADAIDEMDVDDLVRLARESLRS